MTNFEKPREATQPTPDPYAPPTQAGVEPNGSPQPPSYDQTSYNQTPYNQSAGAPAADQRAAAATERPAPVGFDDRGRVRRGRVSTLWVTLIAAAVFLILLIIFIAQNLKKASIHFLGFAGHMPTGLVVLIAAIVGVLLAAIPGTIRILQLRRSLKRNTPKDERTA